METAHPGRFTRRVDSVPPATYFVGSAVFHYLGPAFAVLLFALVEPLGVAWLRIAERRAHLRALAAALAHARARSTSPAGGSSSRWAPCSPFMNVCFYISIDRLPLGTVAAIEFLPVIVLAAHRRADAPQRRGARPRRRRRLPAHRRPARRRAGRDRLRVRQRGALRRSTSSSRTGVAQSPGMAGIDGLAAAMLIALGRRDAARRLGRRARARRPGRPRRGDRRRGHLLGDPVRLRPARHGAHAPGDLRAPRLAPAGDGDRDRDRRAGQIPTAAEIAGVALVVGGVGVHREPV